MLVSPDGDVTITNDGATILDKMQVEHQVRITTTWQDSPTEKKNRGIIFYWKQGGQIYAGTNSILHFFSSNIHSCELDCEVIMDTN